MTNKIKIALAGNPNCGKTTLFNALTGSNQYVGNWPGVTVEKKDGVYKVRGKEKSKSKGEVEGVGGGEGGGVVGGRDGGVEKGPDEAIIQDLPGIYSLSPYSLEEKVSRKYLVEERPDAILNIVDGTNIERNLYLSTQLAELGIPMVLAVNMMDLVRKSGDKIDLERIGKVLNCRVVGISAQRGDGVVEAAEAAVSLALETRRLDTPHVFTGSVEHAIAHIEESIQNLVPKASIRWYAIKIFEHDRDIIESLKIPIGTLKHIEEHIRDCERELDDDSESIITNQRYEFIKTLTQKAVEKKNRGKTLTRSDKIDRVVTNRFLALPIFILSLCAMWFLAVAEKGPGTLLTDWANDGFLGDGWFLPFSQHEVNGQSFDDASAAYAKASASKAAWEEAYREKTGAAEFAADKIDARVAAAVVARDVFVEDEETGAPSEDEEGRSEKWNVDYAAYRKAASAEEPEPSRYGVWVPGVSALIASGLEKIGASPTVASLVNDGAWGGVATVLGFVPVITIVFLFLAFLEDCGYMARVAFIMDRLFRKFGLSGKSFIPMIVGKGCGVPAVMAARTIENERDHRMTALLATFVPCGAKTVIIAMFMAIFFREMWYVAPLMDVIGIAIIVLGGIALKKSRAFAGEAALFVMELPAYHLPTARGILIHTWQRVKGYMLKAGVIIFPACVLLWFIMHFDWSLNLLADEEIEKSILHDLGSWIAWLFKPLGFGTWQGAAATVSAEIAKEQATATLGLVTANMPGATTGAHIAALFGQMSAFPKLAAFSFLVFNLFIPPCMVAIATTFREMGPARWGWFAVAFQLFVGYAIALSSYQLGMLIAGGVFGFWTVVALLVDLFVAWMVLRPMRKEAQA